MRRIGFAVLLAVGLTLAPIVAESQQAGKVYRIGVLANAPPTTPEVSHNWEAFWQGLREHGWVEGQNIVVESRYAQGHLERFSPLAAELVSIKPDLIVAVPGSWAAHAAKQATSTIPIVFIYGFDPVGTGLVAGLARPGGNITGLTAVVGPQIVGKQLELLKEAVPKVSRVAVLTEGLSSPQGLGRAAVVMGETHVAAQALAMTLQVLEVRSANELESAFAAMTKELAGALLVLPGDLWPTRSVPLRCSGGPPPT